MKHSNNLRIRAVLALALPAMAGATDAAAVEAVDRFYISAGAYKANNDVTLRRDSASGTTQGTHVDLKRDFGLDMDKTESYLEIGGTIGRRHRLKAFRYGHDASATRVLERDLVIGDDIYRETAAATGDIDIGLLGASYSWLLHHGERSAFGIGLGAIRYKVSANLAAALDNDGEIEAVASSISESHWAPLLHLEYIRSIADHWRVGVDASYVRKSGGKVSGDAIDLGVKAEFFPWEHFGFALRYNYNDIDLEFEHSGHRDEINIKNRGPQLVATYRF